MTLWTKRQDTVHAAPYLAGRARIALASAALAASLAFAGCGDVVADPDAAPIDAPPPLGTFSIAWNILDGMETLACADVGALSLSLRLVTTGGSIGTAEAFSCSGGQAMSRGITPGNYQVTIDLLAAGNRSLLQSPVIVSNVDITPNQNTEIAMQSFSVSSLGTFTFAIDANATAGNCESVASAGAGIVGVEFALRDTGGTCVPAEFIVADGSESGGTYSNDCVSAPAPLPCIGSDQEVRVTTRSGSYQVTINGQKLGPVDCYSKAASFVLAGAGLETELGSLGLALEYSEACDPNFVVPDAGVPFVDAGVSDASP